jgi:LysR family transcriptional regulator, carnitine catabolism transcriptional activator
MDSHRLRHFVAVVDHGGFTAASRAVFVSQPALSLAVKELEAELGTALFTRIGRRVALTAAGDALLGPARQALRDIESGRAAVQAVTGLLAGSLTICSLPTLAADPMAGMVGSFRRHHPAVRVDLAAPEDSRDLFDLVTNGACELGLTDALHVPASLDALALDVQALVFVHPPGTTPSGGDGTAVRDDTPIVAAPVGTSTRRLLDEQFAALGFEPRIAVVSAQREAIIPLVLSGAGSALVPEPLARSAEAFGAVVSRPDPPAVRRLALVRRPGGMSPAAARFCELAGAPAPMDPAAADPDDRPGGHRLAG